MQVTLRSSPPCIFIGGEAQPERSGGERRASRRCRNAGRSASGSSLALRGGGGAGGAGGSRAASPSPAAGAPAPPSGAFLEADVRAHKQQQPGAFFHHCDARRRQRSFPRQAPLPLPVRHLPRLPMAAPACRKTPSPREMIAGSEADSGRRRPAGAVRALLLLCAALALLSPARAGLLRVPRVYNALITTDERLLPSRAVSVSAPVLPLAAPLIIGPAPVAPLSALADHAPAPAPNATAPAPAPAPAPADAANATARGPAEKEAAAPLSPTLLPLYSPYYSYYPSLLPYSLAPHPLSSLVLFHPLLPPAPAPGPAPGPGPAPATDPSGRALPPGAKDEPDKDAVSVEA